MRQTLVVAYHPLAREAGERMLRQGGNAFDAFVAATLAECVLAEGASSIKPIWSEPWAIDYRGRQIQTSSSRSYGGVWLLTALNIASHTDMASGQAWESADALERELRIAREVWAQPWIIDYRALDDRAIVEQRLRPEYTVSLWQRVQSQLPPALA